MLSYANELNVLFNSAKNCLVYSLELNYNVNIGLVHNADPPVLKQSQHMKCYNCMIILFGIDIFFYYIWISK